MNKMERRFLVAGTRKACRQGVKPIMCYLIVGDKEAFMVSTEKDMIDINGKRHKMLHRIFELKGFSGRA